MNIENLQKRKTEVLEVYKQTKADFSKSVTRENIKGDTKKWVEFCNAKAECMRLGVRI